MRKYVAFSLFLVLLSALMNFKHEEYANSTSQSGNQSLAIPASNASSATNKADDTLNRIKHRWEVGYTFFGWPNGTAVWALLITLFAIAEQTAATTKQAELSRQAIILQYRPIIRIRAIKISDEDNALNAHIVIVNLGGTSAYFTDGGSVTLDWLFVHSPKSHITTVPIGKLSLSAGAVVTVSIPMTNDRLMHSFAKDESRKLNPGMRLLYGCFHLHR